MTDLFTSCSLRFVVHSLNSECVTVNEYDRAMALIKQGPVTDTSNTDCCVALNKWVQIYLLLSY